MRRPLRVLVVGDFTSAPCGIRNFADQTYRALSNHPNLRVEKWDGHYPEIYRRREASEAGVYLPADAHTFDVIHVNWHPIAFNTYGPGHFPAPILFYPAHGQGPGHRRPILSVYLNDIPPWSGCPFHDQADVRFAAEPSPGCIELPYPVADWIDLPDPDPGFIVGCSTVRGDGVEQVRIVCEHYGWEFRLPDRSKGWLTYEEEVQRIARNTVNVLWYWEGRGKSGGLSQAISAKRPVICSPSQMFTHFHDYAQEIFFSDSISDTLESLLTDAHQLWQSGRLDHYRPLRAARDRAWSLAVQQMIEAWEEARKR